MNQIVKALKAMEAEAGKSGRWNLETLCKMAALEIETKAAKIAELTAAHAMQDESLVVLPRHMVNSIEEQLKSLRKFAENCAKLEGQEYQVLVDEARIALAGES